MSSPAVEKASGKFDAPKLALQPRDWQPGFLGSDLGNCRSAQLDFIGDRVQKGRAILAGSKPIGPERSLGRFAGGVDKIRSSDGVLVAWSMGRLGRKGGGSSHSFPGDQVFPVRFEFHNDTCLSV